MELGNRKEQCWSRDARQQKRVGEGWVRGGVTEGRDLEPCACGSPRPFCERYRGYVGTSLIVGGVDLTGPQLYSVHPHGSYSRLPFTALGEHFCPFPTNPAPATLASPSSGNGMAATYLRCPPACRFGPRRGPGGTGGSVPAQHGGEQHLSPTTRSLMGSARWSWDNTEIT